MHDTGVNPRHQLARHNIEMVFYIQPGGMAGGVAESLMAAARAAFIAD